MGKHRLTNGTFHRIRWIAVPALILCLRLPLHAEPAVCTVTQDVLLDMRAFLNDRDPLSITNFSGRFSRRDVMETILVQQILVSGGWTNGVQFYPVPTYERALNAIAGGLVDMSAESVWLEDIEGDPDHLAASPPLIADGEFEAGFYTLPTHDKAMAARTLADLRQLRAVSCKAWRPDWTALTQLGPRSLYHAPRWDSMPRMLAAGRVDFLLAPLQPGPDMMLTAEGVDMVPIPGIKIALSGSRHIAFSTQSPQGTQLREMFTRGLAIHRQNGRLQAAYEECGFFNREAEQWKVITPSEPGPAP